MITCYLVTKVRRCLLPATLLSILPSFLLELFEHLHGQLQCCGGKEETTQGCLREAVCRPGPPLWNGDETSLTPQRSGGMTPEVTGGPIAWHIRSRGRAGILLRNSPGKCIRNQGSGKRGVSRAWHHVTQPLRSVLKDE